MFLPIEFILGAVAGTIALNFVFYAARASGVFTTEKQLAWVVTLASCIFVTLGSIKYFASAIYVRLELANLVYTDTLSLSLMGFFFAYLFWDLFLGIIYYRSTITILTGYIHHSLYMYLSVFSAVNDFSAIFCLMFFNEIPTIVLAIGSIWKKLRSDILFIALFCFTRIFLHSAFALKFYVDAEQRVLWKLMLLVLPMHVYWFYGAVRHYSQKRSKPIQI